VLDSFAALSRLRKRPQTEDDALPHLAATAGGPVTAGQASLGRQEAAPGLAASTAGALLMVATLWVGYHWIGLRGFGRLWPGAAVGMATGLLTFCLSPPGLPVALSFSLAVVAVLVEGAFRGLRVPLAIGGVMIAWMILCFATSRNCYAPTICWYLTIPRCCLRVFSDIAAVPARNAFRHRIPRRKTSYAGASKCC